MSQLHIHFPTEEWIEATEEERTPLEDRLQLRLRLTIYCRNCRKVKSQTLEPVDLVAYNLGYSGERESLVDKLLEPFIGAVDCRSCWKRGLISRSNLQQLRGQLLRKINPEWVEQQLGRLRQCETAEAKR